MSKFRTDKVMVPQVRSTCSVFVVTEEDGTQHIATGQTGRQAVRVVRDQALEKGTALCGNLRVSPADIRE